jgi:U3 small nucleolar RNA-associated protein MPP10
MTEEQHEKLTDMIKQRILDNAFDDVEREAEDEVPEVRKERVVLSEEKSKLSLAQIYEQDFLESQRADGQTDKDDKLSAQQAEATKLWTELSYRLDALSNYHFTPRPVTKELEVISSKPAIAMEEAIPMHVSDAQLMAPEESYRSQVSGAPIADSEKSREERKAIRNARRNKAKRIKNGQAITEQDMLDANVREMQATGQVLDAFAAQASSIAAGETQPDKVKYNVSTSFFQELEKQIEAGPEGQFNKVQKAKKKKAKKTKNWKL